MPPRAYGGTERIVHELAQELARRGHRIVLFASGDSVSPGELQSTVPVALREADALRDTANWFTVTLLLALRREEEFDIVHGHVDFWNLLLAKAASGPVVSTFHGRVDHPFATRAFAAPPRGLVAISRSQAAQHPRVPWEAVVHNGLSMRDMPFERRRTDALCFVGRITPEKGVADAIEVARISGRPLKVAAKVPWLPVERQYHDEVFLPALKRADVEYVGELGEEDRNQLVASCYASLMPGLWPEPFGLTAIESLACGTPVVARRVGALPEIIREEVDGFFADDALQMAFMLERVEEIDRSAIRASVLERFSVERMADGYEAVYARMLAPAVTARSTDRGSPEWTVVPISTPRSRRQALAVRDAAPDVEPAGGEDEVPA